MQGIEAVQARWRPILEEFFETEKGMRLERFLCERRSQGAVIFPPTPFRALELTPFDKVKVVIMGQDPYHERGQAQGLSFSVPLGCKIPPSLRNIFKELEREFGMQPPLSGDLTSWAMQGVLLINAVLTVEEGRAGAHARKGWESLTDRLIQELAQDSTPKVFMLWGGYAQKKASLITCAKQGHLILTCNHPSPLSAMRPPVPFIGCNHFSKANEWLMSKGRAPIEWTIVSPESFL